MSLRTFLMEEYLESIRLERFNMGESGARSLEAGELLLGAGLTRDAIASEIMGMSLRNSPNWGRDDLRDAVAAIHPGAKRENVMITTGTSEALLLLFWRLKAKKVALAMPAFQMLYELPASLGADIVSLRVRWDATGAPYVDEEEWLRQIRAEKPDCLLINTPHNPSGLVLTPAFTARLVEAAAAVGAAVVGDEHYRLHSSDELVVGPTMYAPRDGLFVTGSFIKSLGCTGLRLGWVVGPQDELAVMQNDKNYTTHTVSPFSEWIGYEVMKKPDSDILRTLRGEWKENRAALAKFLASSHHFIGVAPAGGFVTAVGVRGATSAADVDGMTLALAEEKVFLLSLDKMDVSPDRAGGGGELDRGFGYRLGLGLPPADFAEALARMERAGKRLRT